jgi:voltage-gated potassium channel
LLGVGCVLFYSVYWTVVTGTTIGFGDLGPTTVGTKIACVFYLPLAVAVFGEFVGRIAVAYIDRKQDEVESRFMERCMTLCDLDVIDTNKDGRVSENEFLSHMLVALQKVDKEEIDEIMTLFRKLDKSNTGTIDKGDLIEMSSLPVNNS